MTTTNFCKKLSVENKIALDKWAKRLDATEMIIHSNGTVTLYYYNDCICDNYRPSAKELYKRG